MMRRAWILCACGPVAWLLIAGTLAPAAQQTRPRSFREPVSGLERIDERILPAVDVDARIEEDRRPAGRPVPYRVAVVAPFEAGLDDAGTRETLPDGATLWRLRLTSPGAEFLSFKFSAFELPRGAELFFLSVERDYAAGPFTPRHNRPAGRFGSPIIPGDSAVIELFLPPGRADAAALRLESVSHGFRDAMGMRSIPRRRPPSPAADDGAGGGSLAPALPEATAHGPRFADFSCQRDINCPEGAPYQDVKRAVAEAYDGAFVCSGTLLDNTRRDNRYLYLTADHCELWTDPATVVYYWNYENSGCGTNDAPLTFSTGSTDLYHGPQADIDLLELDGADLETTYGIYFAGWDRTAAAPVSAASISFPDDKPKQVAIENDPVTDCAPAGCSGGWGPSYWRVEDWDVGVTEGGSSGAALLNDAQRVVGVLTGGVGTDCADFDWDEYGKLRDEWTNLQPFLDPDGTGATSLDGRDPLAAVPAPPVADGLVGTPLRLSRAAGDTIDATWDAATCSGARAIVVWGFLGDWSAYQGDVGPDCDLGDTGSASFDFAGDDVWFNVIWVAADGAAGHPGASSAGPRSWTAAGLCASSSDDASDDVCD